MKLGNFFYFLLNKLSLSLRQQPQQQQQQQRHFVFKVEKKITKVKKIVNNQLDE